ncbi:MAG TPA: prepilin-type N-terminal cleavage/methylation domain-containing protein [Terriglobales bacterium]|nr:prepilin-type N-terminal cleavage/methylation domain-containing protein [Terriglobales bacterium]
MQTGSRKRQDAGTARGFTLIELMIVIGIIMVLVGIAAGMYQRSVVRAKEATLRSDLSVMRQAIDHYTLDKEAAPQALEDLVNPQSQYLREIPTDPMTNAKDWHADFGDTVMSPDQSTTGIVDVHSNSDRVASDGTVYNTW